MPHHHHVWIPEVAARGWLIFTRDRRIREHSRQVDAVREYRAKMIALTGDEVSNTFVQLEVVMCQWRAIQACWDEPAPFIYTATRIRLRKIELD